MNFEKGIDPIKALNIGWDRRLKKGDKFLLIVSAMKNQPEREFEVIAIKDEISFQKQYVEKVANIAHGTKTEINLYEIRQVKWHIPETAIGFAEMTDNCEHPRWIYTENPISY